MENKNLIAEALLDIAKNSETTFIDASEDKELIETAKKIGIVVPSPDLAVLKTIYAEIDKVNRNGVVLPRKAVEKGLPTLIGKQINWEHDGAGRICGYIIDAKINEDKIEIIGVIFKSLFPEEMEGVAEKFANKKLAVSFEIWNRNPEDGESVVHELENGFRSIDPITFHGCGLLLVNPPACPKAYVYKLVAKKEIEEAEKIVDKIFEENLICASMAIEEPKCKNCTTCTCEEEVKIVEELKVGEEAKERLCPECKQPLKDEEKELCAICLKKKEEKEKSSEETKTEETTVETKTEETPKVEAEVKVEEPILEVKPEEKSEVAETKTEETKVEETKEEVKPEVKADCVECPCTEEKPVKVVSEYTSICVDTYDEATGSYKSESRGHTRTIKTFKDGREEVSEVDNNALYDTYVEKYTVTKAELEEKVNAAKSEKDAEIANLKTEHERMLLEKDTALKNKTDELGKKDQEIAELKNPKVEEKKEKVMTVGAVEGEKNSEIKQQAQNINTIIANKGK